MPGHPVSDTIYPFEERAAGAVINALRERKAFNGLWEGTPGDSRAAILSDISHAIRAEVDAIRGNGPTEIADIDEVRALALELAVNWGRDPDQHLRYSSILEAAREFERFLKGEDLT